MPFKDKSKQREAQRNWVRQKRGKGSTNKGSTDGSTSMGSTDVTVRPVTLQGVTERHVAKAVLVKPAPIKAIFPTIKPFTGELTKERQVSRKGFNT